MATLSLAERLGPPIEEPESEQWQHDTEAADATFQALPRRPKRKQEPEVDPDYLYTPWIEGMQVKGDGEVTKERRLHDEIVAFASYVRPIPQEREARTRVYEFVKDVVKRRFYRSEMNLFGSVAHDLSLPDGDLDVVVRLPGVNEQADKKRTLFQLSAALRASGVTPSVHVIGHARVPVANFQTGPTYGSLNFDIGINNTDGFEAVAIINSYLAKMPALRPLVMVLKGFLRQRKLHSAASSGLSSYALICMAISFLQLNPAERPEEFLHSPLESGSLGTLLLDFFNYYGSTFPYEDFYISVTEGKLLPKESADWINTKHPGRLAVQCLVNPENDVARAAQKIEQVKAVFRSAHQALTEFPFTTPQSNLLGDNNIVRLTQNSIDYRDRIVELVNSKMLLTPPPGYGDNQQRQQPRAYSNNRPPRQDNQYQPRHNNNGYDPYQSRPYQPNPNPHHRFASPRVYPQGQGQGQGQGSSGHTRSDSGRGDRPSSGPPYKKRRY